MVKRGKNQKQKHWSSVNSKLMKKDEHVDSDDMDDEIDAFHKKRDMIPLDIDQDSGDSDEDDQQPVFDYKGIDGDGDDDDDEEEDDDDEEYRDTGLAAKIVRQQKYLREKTGGVEDEFLVDAEEDEKKTVWSQGKGIYYGVDDEGSKLQSSDEDVPAEEEEEVIRLQKERAQSLTDADYGLPTDDDVSDGEPTLEEMKVKGKTKSSADKEDGGAAVPICKEVKKDLSSMSKDEQMDAVYSFAPELAGLLAELNDAFSDLETQVNPLLAKVRKVENAKNEGKNYLEVKQILLNAYCQAIVFYLLLKSEGHPVRDHPVIARIMEIKSLLDKTKELDHFIPDGIKDAVDAKSEDAAASKRSAKHHASSLNSSELNELMKAADEKLNASQFQEIVEPVNMQPSKNKEKKRKLQDPPVSSESVKMLQYRAALEEKLKRKTGSVFDTPRTDRSKKLQKTATGKMETHNDFDDDIEQLEGSTRNNGTLSSKLSSILPAKKKKGISGDDDLPERDDLGERRWKHEQRVLSRAGINSNSDGAQLENEPESLNDSGDDVDDAADNVEVAGSDDDFYNSYKQQRDLKLRMKAQKLSRNPQDVLEADTTVDGKRNITAPMLKNRGLTRNRKKQNPRVVNKSKFEKAKKRRQGQVREIRKQTGPYEWEKTGINPRVSKSIRFKG